MVGPLQYVDEFFRRLQPTANVFLIDLDIFVDCSGFIEDRLSIVLVLYIRDMKHFSSLEIPFDPECSIWCSFFV